MFNGMNGLEILNSWPRFESGELVGFGDEYVNAKGNVSTLRTIVIKDCRDRLGGGYYWKLGKGACAVVVKNGERIKRPPVLAADGKPLEVGQTVWHVGNGIEFIVVRLPKSSEYQAVKLRLCDGAFTGLDPDQLTHQRPVLDADGVPIELGDDLYSVEGGLKLHVSTIDRVNCRIATSAMFALDKWADPSMFTHTKPELSDSWDSVWMDVSNGCETPQGMERRCKALAERGER